MLKTASRAPGRWRALLPAVLLLAGAGGARAIGPTLTATTDYDNSSGGTALHWEKADYADPGVSGSDDIPLGLALPKDYDVNGSTQYPLVLYLHGAAARGNDDNSQLNRATAKHFAAAAQTTGAYNCFVLAPQVPSGDQWVDTSWGAGPYDQTAGTHATHMKLTESLLDYVTNGGHDATLESVLKMHAGHVDQTRLYVVGDSMGAYGTWDIVAWQAGRFAAAMAGAGSGPKNKLTELSQTPFWAMHAEDDGTVPNDLPDGGDPDGDGSLGMLALMDPTFDNTSSTSKVTLDDPISTADDPSAAKTLIYSEFESPPYGHGIAPSWTNDMNSDFTSWLFAQQLPEPGALALLMAGGLMALLRGRRRAH